MSVPLKGKLAYAWARITRQDQIYSRVFVKKTEIQVFHEETMELLSNNHGTITGWLKAASPKGAADQFMITSITYQQDHDDPALGKIYKEERIPGLWAREQVLESFRNWEMEQLREWDVSLMAKQPFRAYIKTILAP